MWPDNLVRWRCRRGLLELDALLIPYFNTMYSTLTSEEKKAFQQLLLCSDRDLLDYIFLRCELPNDNVVCAILSSIRSYRS